MLLLFHLDLVAVAEPVQGNTHHVEQEQSDELHALEQNPALFVDSPNSALPLEADPDPDHLQPPLVDILTLPYGLFCVHFFGKLNKKYDGIRLFNF